MGLPLGHMARNAVVRKLCVVDIEPLFVARHAPAAEFNGRFPRRGVGVVASAAPQLFTALLSASAQG
jgi:hypothetical protein